MWPAVLVGAVCGIAWAAGFRAYMQILAGHASIIDWAGTFLGILLPGAVVGALLGWAESIRRRGGPRGGGPGWRWLALAPIAFAIAPLAMPGALVDFLTRGLGGGAVAVALAGIAGGYALGEVGPLWSRIVCGILALAIGASLVATVPLIGGRTAALDEARGAWGAVIAGSFFIVLCLAASIPFRRVPAAPGSRDAD